MYARRFPIDFTVNPYAGTELDTNKNVAALAIEMIEVRRACRSGLVQMFKNLREDAGRDGWTAELRTTAMEFIRGAVQAAGGRLSSQAFFKQSQDLIRFSNSPQTIRETPTAARKARAEALAKARVAEAAGLIMQGAAA